MIPPPDVPQWPFDEFLGVPVWVIRAQSRGFDPSKYVRSTSDSGRKGEPKRPLLGANSGREQMQQKLLLDHLVGN
jgi:hypothetical protein